MVIMCSVLTVYQASDYQHCVFRTRISQHTCSSQDINITFFRFHILHTSSSELVLHDIRCMLCIMFILYLVCDEQIPHITDVFLSVLVLSYNPNLPNSAGFSWWYSGNFNICVAAPRHQSWVIK